MTTIIINTIKQGGIVIIPLILCSLISLAVIIERLFFWISLKKKQDPILRDQILQLFQKQDWDAIKKITKANKDHIIKILISGILHKDFSLSKALEAAAAEEIKKMRKYMNIIDTIITSAPLLGILGTVTGIIASFTAISSAGIDQAGIVSAGIAQALITTAAGLVVAIFSLFFYNFFNTQIENAISSIESYATSLEVLFEKEKSV
ncbi:MAG: MotA/TolQ/ExbB proton channel family protein [Deltaproteobacteria bacterium]|nr:MotA/TolQ/ExbB proton channel family protein [Deltaproteobacteria bacterium]